MIRRRTRYVRALNLIVADTAGAVHVAGNFREDPEYFQLRTAVQNDVQVICSEPYPGNSLEAPGWSRIPNGSVATFATHD